MQYNPQLIFLSLPEANAELQLLLGLKVYILPVTGADHFYTDGASVGSTYRVEMPDSSLNYLMSDGTVRFAQSRMLSAHEATLRQFLRNRTCI